MRPPLQCSKSHLQNFNPRTPQGVRRLAIGDTTVAVTFQSTHPAGGATNLVHVRHSAIHISIHAPRRGCDPGKLKSCMRQLYFNPRTPQGVRRKLEERKEVLQRFQSTHPAGGATQSRKAVRNYHVHFNPRTPQGVRPVRPGLQIRTFHHFNPRTPQGVRQQILTKNPSTLLSISTKLSKI